MEGGNSATIHLIWMGDVALSDEVFEDASIVWLARAGDSQLTGTRSRDNGTTGNQENTGVLFNKL